MVTLAPSHPIRQQGKVVKEVDFQVGKKLNRLENKVSGKFKRVSICTKMWVYCIGETEKSMYVYIIIYYLLKSIYTGLANYIAVFFLGVQFGVHY